MADYEAKQVIVMRKDLNMRKGKMVAEGAHAAMRWMIPYVQACDMGVPGIMGALSDAEKAWIDGSFAKICVYVNSEEELMTIHHKARADGLRSEMIQDRGLTEFDGVPTYTCCAVGPDLIEKIDAITSSLPLL